jgi:hypothetical protein
MQSPEGARGSGFKPERACAFVQLCAILLSSSRTSFAVSTTPCAAASASSAMRAENLEVLNNRLNAASAAGRDDFG